MSAVLQWIAGGDTGMSSKAIWSHMMTGTVANAAHPHDCDDFGRCYRLLELAPEWESRMGEMGRYSAEWAALAARWSELSAMFAPIAATYGPPYRRKTDAELAQANAMRAVMDEILTTARVCMDCGAVGMSGWTTYPDRTQRCYECAQKYDRTAKGTAKTITTKVGNATMSFTS